MERKLVLGLDTSAYTTSAALADTEGNIIYNGRKLLNVKQGERGLRQSDALFQHWNNMPELINEVKSFLGVMKISAVSVSSRPRSVEGSYMPVFLAGANTGRMLSDMLGVPYFENSHQEGHVRAAVNGSVIEGSGCFISYHLSGGTTELLLCRRDESEKIKKIGGSLDISFGQVIDRAGVAMGLPFPAGKYLDEKACSLPAGERYEKKLKSPYRKGELTFNLSGIETQALRMIDKGVCDDRLCHEIFEKLSETAFKTAEEGAVLNGADGILFAGGVSSSSFFRKRAGEYFAGSKLKIVFADPALSSDNAAGTALIGADRLKMLRNGE